MSAPELVEGVCHLDDDHTGRCRDGLGSSWEGPHPSPEVRSWQQVAKRAAIRADRAEHELRRLRDAVGLLLTSSPDATAALAECADPDQLSLLDMEDR